MSARSASSFVLTHHDHPEAIRRPDAISAFAAVMFHAQDAEFRNETLVGIDQIGEPVEIVGALGHGQVDRERLGSAQHTQPRDRPRSA